MRTVLAAALFVGITSPALAAKVVLPGNTTGGPTYNRPVTTVNESTIGTAVRFQVTEFVVDADGTYILTLLNVPLTYDPFLALYDGTFEPSAPLAGLIALDDDIAENVLQSRIEIQLTAASFYQAVVSGFDNADFGAYSLTIEGPGAIFAETISPVPEPATWGMMLVGLGLIGASMRYRQRRSVVSYGQ